MTIRRSADGRFDPMLMTIVFGVAGAIFLILAFTVPAVMAANDPGNQCGPANFLNREEQQICSTPRKDTYFARAQPSGAKFLKTYRVKWSDLKEAVHRIRTWVLKGDLSKGPIVFPITTPISVFYDMSINCTGDKCDSVKMYLLDSSYWKKANKKGYFNENQYGYVINNFIEPKVYNSRIDSRSTNYLVFANNNLSSYVTCVLNLDYSVYDMSKAKVYPLDNETKCEFDDVQEGEVIMQEYADRNDQGPAMINVTINGTWTRTPTVIALAIVFTLLAIILLGISIMFMLFMCGKLGDFGKVIGKKFQEREFGFTSAFGNSQTLSSGAVITRERLITSEYDD